MRRRLIGAGFALVLLAGCTSGPFADEEPAPSPTAPPRPQASVAPDPDPGGTIDSRPLYTDEITGTASVRLHRVDKKHMVAEMTVANTKGDAYRVWPALADQTGPIGEYPWRDFSGIAWLDPDGRSLHKPYFRPDRSCLCSRSGKDERYLSEGDELTVYAVLDAPPKDVTKLTLVTTIAAPFVDVPVRSGAPDGLDYDRPKDEPDAEPDVADLQSVTETRHGLVFADDDHTAVSLSADELFFSNSARLTGKGTTLVETIARRIHAARLEKVKIGGHTDDTDDASVAQPLSTAQAAAVADLIEETLADENLTKPELEITSKGYGDEHPIADNGSERGRKRNRRVTISMPADAGLLVVPRGVAAAATSTPSPSPSPSPSGSPSPSESPSPSPSPSVSPSAEPRPPSGGEGRPAREFAESARVRSGGKPAVDIALTGLRAVGDSTALLGYEVTNTGDEDVLPRLDTSSDQWREFRAGAAHAVTLDGPREGRRAHPLRVRSLDRKKADPYCLCSSTSGIFDDAEVLGAGETRRYYAILPIEPGTTATDVKIGHAPAMKGVRID